MISGKMSLCGLGRVLLRPRPRSTPLLPTATASSTASAVRATSASVHTAVLLMNMGGPSKSEEVHGFLNNLFNDRDLMCIGPAFLQPYVADYITKRRTPKIQEQVSLCFTFPSHSKFSNPLLCLFPSLIIVFPSKSTTKLAGVPP